MKKFGLIFLFVCVAALAFAGQITSSSTVEKTQNHSLKAKWLGGTISVELRGSYSLIGGGYYYSFSWHNGGSVVPESYTWKINGVKKQDGISGFFSVDTFSLTSEDTVSCTVTYGITSYTTSYKGILPEPDSPFFL